MNKSPQGTDEAGQSPAAGPASPLSPFNESGYCRSCGGYGEHFSRCPHATWERREIA